MTKRKPRKTAGASGADNITYPLGEFTASSLKPGSLFQTTQEYKDAANIQPAKKVQRIEPQTQLTEDCK
jgi:hypothetical protein